MGVSAIPAPRQLIVHHPAATPPDGYIKANGAAISRTVYAWLFGIIGTTFGAGDGSTTFNVPDLRAVAVRGLDDGRGLDASRVLGSYQADQIASHTVTITDPGHTHVQTKVSTGTGSSLGPFSTSSSSGANANGSTQSSTTGITASYTGGNETTMKNVALLACIAYAP